MKAVLVCGWALATVVAWGESAELRIVGTNGERRVERREMMRMADGALRLKVATDEMRGVRSIDVIPDWARVPKGEGYWVFPDGHYGAFTRDRGSYFCRRARLAMYGVCRPQGTYVAIVKGLRTEFGSHVEARKGVYEIFPRFEIRKIEFDPYEDIVIDCYRLTGDDANYSGMARRYRQWQLGRGEVRPLVEKIKTSPALAYSTKSIFLRYKFGRTFRRDVDHGSFATNTPPMTVDHTFDEFMGVLREAKALGMDDVDMCLVGWQREGHDGPFPDHFPVDPRFGGEPKMREAVKLGHDLGYRMSVHLNYHNYYPAAKRWRIEDVCKGPDGKPRPYWLLPAGLSHFSCFEVMVNRYVDSDFAHLRDIGIDGILHHDVTSAEYPTPCHDPMHPNSRGKMAGWQLRLCDKCRETFGGSSSESGLDHIAGGLDNILYVAWDVQKNPLIDGMLPVWPIVYNGICMSQPFYGTMDASYPRVKGEKFSEGTAAYHWIPTPKERMLKVFEWGGRPAFYYNPYTDLRPIKRMYDLWQPLKHLQLVFIREHVTLATGVTATRYENGEEVVCNASRAPFAYRGETVAPMGFRLIPAPAAASAAVNLAVRGAPADRPIVIAADAAPVVRHAAEELSRYVGLMTGVRLAVATDADSRPDRAVYLGRSRFSDVPTDGLGGDGFRFTVKDGDLHIAVGAAHGALFAVYDLLERYGGCEWLAADFERVPEKDAFAVPDALDERHVPAFVQRDMNWRDVWKDPDFAAKMKLNGFHIPYRAEHGGRDISVDPGYATFDAILPAAKHFDAHPAWYAEVNGRRVKEKTQLCLSNPEVIERVAEDVRRRIRAHSPSVRYYNVMQNDWRNWCTCAKCRALDEREGSPAASVITFANAVADRIAAEYPDVFIRTLAYSYSRPAPKTVRARRNVLVVLCPDACDCSKPIVGSRYPKSRTYEADLMSWKRLAPTLSTWDYTANFRAFLRPFPDFGAERANLAWYRDNRVSHVYLEGISRAGHMADAELRTWLFSHLLWDPSDDPDRLLDRFLRGWFGAAASEAKEYYRRLASLPRDEAKRPMRMWGEVADATWPMSFFDWASENWRKAAAKVSGREARNVRWALNAADFNRIVNSDEGAIVDARAAETGKGPRFDGLKAAAERIVADFDAEPDTWKFGEDTLLVERMARTLRRFAHPGFAPVRGHAIEETLFLVGRSSKASVVDDPAAENGRSLRLSEGAGGWTTQMYFGDVRTDPGRRYRLRARLRIVPGADSEGRAVRLGVHDIADGSSPFRDFHPKAKELSTDYRWYDLGGPFAVTPTMTLWFGMGDWDRNAFAANPSVREIFLDRLEILETERK